MLITLGIIGVVAALTIPTLVTAYQKKVTAERLKEVYAQMIQATKLYESETGEDVSSFNTRLNPKDFLEQYFAPYMKVVGRCTNKAQCYDNQTPLAIDRKTIAWPPQYMLQLINGTYIGIVQVDAGTVFYIDINGSGKPNLSGRDIFYFYLVNVDTIGENEGCQGSLDIMKATLTSGLYPGSYDSCFTPHGTESRDRLLGLEAHRSCNRKATHLSMGDACAAVIMKDGWKISKDYPWN